MSYSVLNCKTHYSILQSIIQPKPLVDRLTALGIKACAMTDYNTISGSVATFRALKEAKIKPLLGCEFNITAGQCVEKTQDNRHTYGLTLIAKNRKGWDSIVKLVSISNRPENFYYKPRLDLQVLAENLSSGNVLVYSGGQGSLLRHIYTQYGPDGTKIWLKKLKDIFGEENVFVNLTSEDAGARNDFRQIAKESGIKTFGSPNPHYCRQEDVILHRIVLCNEYKTTLKRGHESFFFHTDKLYILPHEEMLNEFDKEEVDNTNLIAELVEDYDIYNKPIFPSFDCPDGLSEDEYLRKLCQKGWLQKIKGRIPKEKEQEYVNRIKYELEVLQGANLSSYFLVLADIMDYVRKDGISMTGVARGSAGGCLTSYLTNITSVDPIPYGLQFERFYNAGRNSPGKVSYPDIDVDIPIQKREDVIQYLKDKYGADKVGQIRSFQTIKGRGALKMVFRAYDDVSFTEQNAITEHIMDEAKIADELEEMKQEGEEPSIIMWALENKAEELKDWVFINDDGKLEGPLAGHFEKAIKLEKTKSAESKHAAGVIIASRPLEECCPMVYDPKSKTQVVGYEMNDAEAVGLIKMDILGLAMLDRLMTIKDILRNGEITI